MENKECAQGHVVESGRELCTRCNGPAVEVMTVPTEMITDEMREAGVDETTPLLTREEVVEMVGEEAVADLEAEALQGLPEDVPAEEGEPKEEAPAEDKGILGKIFG